MYVPHKHSGQTAVPAMPSYRCYFLNDQDHIQAYESIEADALGEAVDRALAMLKARPQHRRVELWQGARRLYPAVYGNVLRKPRQQP